MLKSIDQHQLAPSTSSFGSLWICFLLSLCVTFASVQSTAAAAVVIENNNFAGTSFTGTGPLRIKLTEAIGGRSDRIECTHSTFSGTVTSPIPDARAKITSWTMTGCNVYLNNGSVPSGTAPTQMLNLANLPPVEAISKTSVRVYKPSNGPITVKTEYFRGNNLCTAWVELDTSGYTYTPGASANQLSALWWEFYSTPPFDPSDCLNGGTVEFESRYSFPDPQFEVVERNYQAPTIQTRYASSPTKTSATLTGAITPNGLPTQYHFEYGPSSSYGTKVPVPNGSIGSNLSVAQLVSHTISGLQAGTTYYFRLTASNAKGTTTGPPQTFTTPALWTTLPTPNPEGASLNRLESVSCEPSSTNMCMAVGQTTVAGSEKVLAERWNGSSWALSTPLLPAEATVSSLNGVACPTATSCRAVGTYKTVNGAYSLAEHWNGTAWSIVPTANAPGASSTVLTDVSCPSGTSVCTAVGHTVTGSVATPIAERWNGTNWSMQTVPLPPNSSGSVLESVACQGTGFCMAVGRYTETGGQQVRPFSVAWNGTNWSTKTVPDPEASWKDQLSDVDCTTTTLCTAAGFSIGSPPGWLTMVVRWNGTAWVTQPSPNPPDSGVFWGIDCVNASSNPCNAVGWWASGTNQPATGITGFTLASRWNGAAWALESTPNPSNSKTNILLDVSCRVSTCIAVGSSTNASGASTTLSQQR